MLIATPDIPLTTIKRRAAGSVLLAGFTASLFLSAFLLFSVQPVVSRMLLPRLGGSPAVWNTCVCFFQAALLLGYGYAHFVAGRLQPRAQLVLHALVLASGPRRAAAFIGRGCATRRRRPDRLAAGAPSACGRGAFCCHRRDGAAAATLVQPNHPSASAGPLLPVRRQQLRQPARSSELSRADRDNTGPFRTGADSGRPALPSPPLPWWLAASRRNATRRPRLRQRSVVETAALTSKAERLRWVVLAFVPSALMLAVTTYITTDIAATPLFWVVPLAIYIGTFMLAFARRQFIGQRTLLALQGMALAAAGLVGMYGTPTTVSLIISLSAFTLTAAVCHTELAQRRPDARGLTGYYLLISLGGALGGVFCALLAPVLFLGPWEYPLLLIAACLLRPPPLATRRSENWAIRGDLLLPVALTALAIALLWAASPAGPEALRPAARVASIVVPGAALLWFAKRRVRLAMALAGFLLFPALMDASDTLIMTRSFFGVHRVRRLPNEDLVVLQHGTTVHGMQSTRPGEELTPLGYYDRSRSLR